MLLGVKIYNNHQNQSESGYKLKLSLYVRLITVSKSVFIRLYMTLKYPQVLVLIAQEYLIKFSEFKQKQTVWGNGQTCFILEI